MALITCRECGKSISSQAAACPNCGCPIAAASNDSGNNVNVIVSGGINNVPKSRTVYVLLACFLGIFGIHNFYAGRTGCGVVQLLLTLLCGVGLLIVPVWCLIEMLTVTIDGRGMDMKPCSPLAMMLAIIIEFWPIILLLSLFGYYSIFGGGSGGILSETKSIVGNELAFQRTRGEAAGELMKRVAPRKKVLVIAEPNYDKDQFLGAMLDAFKKAYGSQELEIDSVEVPPNAEEEITTISDLMTAKSIKEVIAKHTDAGVILFATGLPENPDQLDLLSQDGHPAVFLFGRGQATNRYLAEQLRNGNIAGIIIGKRGVKYSTKATGDSKETFNIRYILVTKDNFDANKESFK